MSQPPLSHSISDQPVRVTRHALERAIQRFALGSDTEALAFINAQWPTRQLYRLRENDRVPGHDLAYQCRDCALVVGQAHGRMTIITILPQSARPKPSKPDQPEPISHGAPPPAPHPAAPTIMPPPPAPAKVSPPPPAKPSKRAKRARRASRAAHKVKVKARRQHSIVVLAAVPTEEELRWERLALAYERMAAAEQTWDEW